MKKLEEELHQYSTTDFYPFHMPGHKRIGDAAKSIDITEIDGFDNLHAPEGILKEEMEYAAQFYGVQDTFFLVNGSTCGLLAAISAAVPRGGTILIPRGAHISVYHAAYLRDLAIRYIEEVILSSPVSEGIDPSSASNLRESKSDCTNEEGVRIDSSEGAGESAANQDIDAVLLTSPSYEGVVQDVRSWADYAHRRGIPLIVDEAHGAHFSMHPYFPESAIKLGADLVIQSTHKTLTSMTQTALLHNVTGRVDSGCIRKFLRIYESSSPSYVLLSSITKAIHDCAEGGAAYFENYVTGLKKLRMTLSGMKYLTLNGANSGETVAASRNPSGANPGEIVTASPQTDPGKLLIRCTPHMSGPELYDLLREKYHLQPEMKTPDAVLLMTSVNDTDEGFERLSKALLEIDAKLEEAPGGLPKANRPAEASHYANPCNSADRQEPDETSAAGLPPVRTRLAAAYDSPAELCPLEHAAGRISADFIIVFPPDAPIIIPGEAYTEEIIALIRNYMKQGFSLTGIEDGMVRCTRHFSKNDCQPN